MSLSEAEIGMDVIINIVNATNLSRSLFFTTQLLELGIPVIALFAGAFFIIELPEYKVPSLKFAFGSMLERGKAPIIKAGTIILVCNTVVQIMQSFDTHFQVVEECLENIIIAVILVELAIMCFICY